MLSIIAVLVGDYRETKIFSENEICLYFSKGKTHQFFL